MNREESAKVAQLYAAQAEGKRFEFHHFDGWQETTPNNGDFAVQPDRWRIAPDLPPKPSQEWLDKHGVEIVAGPMSSERARGDYPTNQVAWLFSANEWVSTYSPAKDCFSAGDVDNVYVIRRRAPQVKPWTIDTVPMPLVVKPRATGNLIAILAAKSECVVMLHTDDGKTTSATYDELREHFTQRDGSPCGEVVK